MISIEQYVCNIIAGSHQITDLYFAIDRARDIVNKNNKFQRFNKKISFRGIGTNVYSSNQLVQFENLSYCTPYQSIINNIDDKPSLDQYIILLLKGRNTIRNLFQSCCKAKFMREQAKTFCYTFINPFGKKLTNVNKNKLQFNNAFNFITFYCQCERTVFNPILVFNGLLN